MTLAQLSALSADLSPTERLEIDGDTKQALWWDEARLIAVIPLV